jgi:two-component system, NtrC family, sensor kinase
MVTPPDETTADPCAVIATLRAERDAALTEKAALAKALAERSTVYAQRIEHPGPTVDIAALKAENEELRAAQVAGLEVLQTLVAAPGDTQPVFDLIARQAARLCNAPFAAVVTFDGTMMHLASQSGFEAAQAEAFAKQFPRPAGSETAMGRAILSQRVEQIEDTDADPGHGYSHPVGRASVMGVPLLRDGVALGAIAIGRPVTGLFPETQIALLRTFAEQAVIAITSAETYRALQSRTSDLQEALEYQTATSDVLKVISRSTFDLQPVLDTVAETAARLCDADQAAIWRREGETVRLVTDHT